MLYQRQDYTLALICSGLPAYAAMCEGLAHSPLLEEPIHLALASHDAEVTRFLQEKFAWREGQPIATSDWVVALARAFPPPFAHRDILAGRIDPEAKANLALRRGELAARRDNALTVNLSVKSPEHLPLAQEEILGFIEENYHPLILSLAGHDDFVPDDFTATRELLAGEPEVIRREHRTMRLTLPFRDVTCSVRLLELTGGGSLQVDLPEGMGEDFYILPIEIPHPEYLHLCCLAVADTCRRFHGLDWTLIPHETP